MSEQVDDLPWHVTEQLRVLDLELKEGDITMKGYEKKKTVLMKPYTKSTAHTDQTTGNQSNVPFPQDLVINVSSPQKEPMEDAMLQLQRDLARISTTDITLNADPEEPSAADVKDFLDHLPSPKLSPMRKPSTDSPTDKGSNLQGPVDPSQEYPTITAPLEGGQAGVSRPPPPAHNNALLHYYSGVDTMRPSAATAQPRMPAKPNHPFDPYAMPVPPRPDQAMAMGSFRPYAGPHRPPPPPPSVTPFNQHRPQPPQPQSQPQAGMAPPYTRPVYRTGSLPVRPGQSKRPPLTHGSVSNPMLSYAASVHGLSVESPNNLSPISATMGQSVDMMPDPASPISRMSRNDADFGKYVLSLDPIQPRVSETASMNGSISLPNGRELPMNGSPVHYHPALVPGGKRASMLKTQPATRQSVLLRRSSSRYSDSNMVTNFKAIDPPPQPRLPSINDTTELQSFVDLAGRQMIPLKPRQIDTLPLDPFTQMDLGEFKNLPEMLRFRGTHDAIRMHIAFTSVDGKGKEPQSITWDKLNARAEKVAVQLRTKSGLQFGDSVVLLYRKVEMMDYMIAMFGCFLAGLVAVPINTAEDLAELSFILNLTKTYLILTTDYNLRAFNRDMQARSIEFPPNVEWWKTNDFGSWYPNKKENEYPTIKLPDLAYIEYTKSANGELKGVTITHDTLMSGSRAMRAATTETVTDMAENGVPMTRLAHSMQRPDVVFTHLEPRQQIGFILGVACTVYTGNHMIFANSNVVDSPAAWVYIVSKYKVTVALSNYVALVQMAEQYESNPKETHSYSRKVDPNLSSLHFLLVDTTVVKPDLNDIIANKLLKPLGHPSQPLDVVCPVLSLPEFGGMIISMRDYLGPAQLESAYPDREETEKSTKTQPTYATGSSRTGWKCLLDADALKANRVVVIAAGEEAEREAMLGNKRHVLVSSFGFPMPDATVAIVDPDSSALCPADTVGEIWIDAPYLPGGFWDLPVHSEAMFHAKPVAVSADTLQPELYPREFLRTGLVGTLIDGRLIVLGPFDWRIRQQKIGESLGYEEVFYSHHIEKTVCKRADIRFCSAFEVLVSAQHLPVIACESSIPRQEIINLAADISQIVNDCHGLRVFAVVICAPDSLPRSLNHGRRMVHTLMTKQAFLAGRLKIRYVKLDVDRTVFNIAAGPSTSEEFWKTGIAYDTAMRLGYITSMPGQQHTGMETVEDVLDERTRFNLSKFTNIIDMLQWRASLYTDETAYVSLTQSSGALNRKVYSWKKINYKVAAMATYLLKKGFKHNRRAIILMPFGIDAIIAIYACMAIGVIPIPMEPPEVQQQKRIPDDVARIVSAVRELDVNYILVTSASDDIMRNRAVHEAVKKSTTKQFKLPDFTNVDKAAKGHKLLGKESGVMVRGEWTTPRSTALITVDKTSNDCQVYTFLSHPIILNRCRAQKMTCQMKPQRSIVTTGINGFHGLVLLQAAFCGIYVGCCTVVMPLQDVYARSATLFEELYFHKAKDVCVPLPLAQYTINQMLSIGENRRLALHNIQNMMIPAESRPRPMSYQHMARFFTAHGLEKEAINTVYSHPANPMVTTRSYMLLEPLTLVIDATWLRQGVIRQIPSEEETPGDVVLHDSGIVPSNTMVAIVNPETLRLCPNNMVGEIWVASDSNAQTMFGLDTKNHSGQFEATIYGMDPRIKYMRTGDLGFLLNVRRRVDHMMESMMEEGQCLYVLGSMNEMILRNGLIHFPIDIETTIEHCYPDLVPNGSVIFQAGMDIVVVATVKSRESALPAIPLIVSAILEIHSLLVDSVAIVLNNQLPKSRYGDKQRGKTRTIYLSESLPTLCVKRITNVNPKGSQDGRWSQSQVSVDETASIHTKAMSVRGFSMLESEETFHAR